MAVAGSGRGAGSGVGVRGQAAHAPDGPLTGSGGRRGSGGSDVSTSACRTWIIVSGYAHLPKGLTRLLDLSAL